MNKVPFLPIIGLAAFAAMPAHARSNAPEQTAGSPAAVFGHSRSNHESGAMRQLATGKCWDSSIGADAIWGNLTLGVSYSYTDIFNSDAACLQPGFSVGHDGSGAIADGTIVVPLTAAF